jgi:hypothetical protein
LRINRSLQRLYGATSSDMCGRPRTSGDTSRLERTRTRHIVSRSGSRGTGSERMSACRPEAPKKATSRRSSVGSPSAALTRR